MANGKRQTWICSTARDQVFPLLVFNSSFLLQKISRFSFFFIHENCFELFYLQKQPFVANVILNPLIVVLIYHASQNNATKWNPSICIVIAQMSPSHQIRLSAGLFTQVFILFTPLAGVRWWEVVFGSLSVHPATILLRTSFLLKQGKKKVKGEASIPIPQVTKCHRFGTLTDNSNLWPT